MPITNQIRISGLLCNISEEQLLHKLSCAFSTVGQIKMDERTRKPSIILFQEENNKNQLSGIAKITYEEEQAATKAIAKYNGTRVPILNNSQIFVEKWEMKTDVPSPK
ncbi:unnamed protein product, partial [Rotaria sp. Silwood1]